MSGIKNVDHWPVGWLVIGESKVTGPIDTSVVSGLSKGLAAKLHRGLIFSIFAG